MTLLFHQDIVILRAPLATDRYGNEKPDWDNPVRTAVAGVNVQPASTPPTGDEETDDRQVTVTEWELQTPQGVDIDLLPTDRVEYDGMTLEVAGKVGRWPDPFGPGVHHVEARLKEVA